MDLGANEEVKLPLHTHACRRASLVCSLAIGVEAGWGRICRTHVRLILFLCVTAVRAHPGQRRRRRRSRRPRTRRQRRGRRWVTSCVSFCMNIRRRSGSVDRLLVVKTILHVGSNLSSAYVSVPVGASTLERTKIRSCVLHPRE